MSRLKDDWAVAYLLSSYNWEELVAVAFEIRQEQKRGDGRTPTRKGHAHATKEGRFWHKQLGIDCGDGRYVRAIRPALARTKGDHHRTPLAKPSINGMARRLEREGNELSLHIRLRQEMRNEEVISISDFGPQIDGLWDTAAVVHRLGNIPATTEIAAWRVGELIELKR